MKSKYRRVTNRPVSAPRSRAAKLGSSAAAFRRRDTLVIPLMLFLLSSCAPRALGVPRDEAENRLQTGDIGFLVNARAAKLKEIARIDPSAPFYAALLLEDYYTVKKDAGQAGKKTAAAQIETLYKTALQSPLTRAAAANKLIREDPDFYFEDAQKKKPASLASTAENSEWSKAFTLLKNAQNIMDALELQTAQKALRSYFFAGRYGSPAGIETAAWLLKHLQKLDTVPLPPEELQAAEGRLSVARRDYAPAYKNFYGLLNPGANQPVSKKNIYQFFMRYPQVLNDAGRAAQYGGPLNEAVKCFAQADADIQQAVTEGSAPKTEAAAARYLLNYYQGRFYRAQKKQAKAAAAFTAALSLAPDGEQEDACIWYLIDLQYAEKPEDAIPYFKKYGGRWNDPSYFDDLLDKFIYYCTSKKKWQNLLDIYPALEHTASEKIRAKYAYVTGRALEENYITGKPGGLTAKGLLNAAYEQEADYYYRAMAGKRLGKNPAVTRFDESAGEAAGEAAGDAPQTDTMRFLLAFFRFGCARFAAAYITEVYDSLSVPELRLLARRFTKAGRYGDAIRLVVKYSKRPGFIPSRADLELSYPRAFSDLVERYAKKTKMKESYLYALMRTESIFIPDIVSRAGALGLTQLMPDTGRQMAEILASNGGPNYIEDGSINLLDPELNIHLGALYYKDMEMRMGSAQTALMAYNGGIGRVRRWRRNFRAMPEDLFAETIEITETREYSKKVIGDAAVYQSLYY